MWGTIYELYKPSGLHFGVKKKNHYPPIWISIAHIWSIILFPRGILFFQGVLTKFPYLEKIVDLMKDLNMNTKALFPCGEGSNLILGTGMENQIFILRTAAAIKFFHQILKK